MTEALLDVSLRVMLIVGIGALVALIARSAAVRHAVWTATLCGMLLMPALTALLSPIALPILPAREAAAYVPPADAEVSQTRPPAASKPSEELTSVSWVIIVYGLGALVCAARLIRSWDLARRLLAGSTPVPGLVQVRQSRAITVPITLGFRNPVVLLPAAWSEWGEWKLRAVLAHEFAHIDRKDTWVSALACLNCCVFWFHPCAWWLKKELADCAERAADDASILATGDREGYAELLLEVASGLKQPSRMMGTAMARRSQVGRRIHRILDDSRRLTAGLTWRGWALLIAIALPLICAAAQLQPVPQAVQRTRSVLIETSVDDIPALEAKLNAEPENEELRARLIGLYTGAGNREARAAHILWLIEHHPDSRVHQRYPHLVLAGDSPAESLDDHRKICEAWMKQVDLHPADSLVLVNASDEMSGSNPDKAEDLLKRARRIDPANGAVPGRLALLYSRLIHRPEMAGRIVADLKSSTDAEVVGQTGRMLSGSGAGPVNDLGAVLLERARALDPQKWGAAKPAASSDVPGQIRVGGSVQAAKLVKKVDPEYPPLAKQARIQGTVRFTVVIGKDGKVQNTTLVSGHPLLVQAAMDALKQWEYAPTLLNGNPVEVVTQADVNFTLSGSVGVISGIAGSVGSVPARSGPEFPPTEGVQRIRVGQNVQAAKLIDAPAPEHPPLAKQARIQGRVQLSVLIDQTGEVSRVIPLSGHPLLVPAAQEAVKKYRYQPTLLNGQPVEVVTIVDINFQLP